MGPRGPAAPAAAGTAAGWRWIYSFLRPHRAALAALIALSLAVAALALLQPWFTKLLLDDGLLARDFPRLVKVALLMFAAGVAATLLGGVNRYFYTRLSGRILFGIRESVFAHLQRLSPAFHLRHRSGDVLARLDGDVAEIQRFAVDSLFAGVSGVFGLLGTVGFMLWISPGLSLFALVLLPLEWLYLRHMRARVQQRVRTLRERSSDISSFLVETLPAIKYIQSVAASARETERLSALNRHYLDDLLRLQLTEFATSAVPANLSGALRAAVFIVGGHQVIEGTLAPGALIAFSAYLGMAMGPVQSLLGVYMAVSRVRVNVERVALLQEATPDVEPAGTLRLDEAAAVEIRFEKICFRYPGEAQPVLREASACLQAGTKTGVRAASGSGKSTLVDLLLRHYDPEAGLIRVNGHDLRALDLAAWRRRVALVAQDIVLFRGSILDNIRYANPDASEARVQEVARLAQLDPLLARLPHGLDTAIGERGARLSGGERQRIAIARALLQDPLLIILDEATSAIDATAESAVIAEIDRLFPVTTRLVISHREAPLDNAGQMLTIEDGRLRRIEP